MNVGQLIEALKAFDLDLEVFTEGCDCDGDVGKVSLENGTVYLQRSTLYG